jgi:DNA polymerase-1
MAIIESVEEFEEFCDRAAGFPTLVLDLETTGLHPYHGDRIIGVALAIPPTGDGGDLLTAYLPLRHEAGANVPLEALRHLRPLLADPERYLLGWNLKFDAHFLLQEGLEVRNHLADSMLAAHLANENEMTFRLKDLGKKYLGAEAGADEAELLAELKLLGLKKEQMGRLPAEKVAPYAEQDVWLTWHLGVLFQEELERQCIENLWPEVNEYMEVTLAMERRGVLVDVEGAQRLLEASERHLEELLASIRQDAGLPSFNPNSPVQVGKLLKVKKTDVDSLNKLKHPVAKKIVAYRSWTKARSTYYEAFLRLADANHRIHTSLNLIGTISGRISCREPNLQALPRESDIFKVRGLVVAPPGYRLMAWDWSQAELRLMAHYTRDPFLMEAYWTGADVHGLTAERLGIGRYEAKRINFGSVYGIGVPGLMHELNISRKVASEFLAGFHQLMPGVGRLYRTAEAIAKRDGVIPMWTGRRRHFRADYEHHKASSNLIQGGVAEMMRVAITALYPTVTGLGAMPVLQVHDEILFEVPDDPDTLARTAKEIKTVMEDYDFAVPIVAEGKSGYSWGSMEPWVDPDVIHP